VQNFRKSVQRFMEAGKFLPEVRISVMKLAEGSQRKVGA